MILINPGTIEKIPLCRHWKLAVLGRWPLLRGDCLWRFHFNHENTVEWKLYRGVPCLWFLQFLGPVRWNIIRSDQHASCMNLHKWSPVNNSNLSITSSFQCLHSDHLPQQPLLCYGWQYNIPPRDRVNVFLFSLHFRIPEEWQTNEK